jgi:hypothetical protein
LNIAQGCSPDQNEAIERTARSIEKSRFQLVTRADDLGRIAGERYPHSSMVEPLSPVQ